jgi:hypothetical protein
VKIARRVVVTLVVALPVVVHVQPGAAATTAIVAAADAYVHAVNVTANTGNYVAMRVRNADKTSYVRFDVPSSVALGGSVTRARLRLYATTDVRCSMGLQVWRAATATWSERTITYANQPGPTGPVLVATTWAAPGWVEVDVTSAVVAGAPVSFLLRHADGCSVSSDIVMNTREATTNRPELVVETSATTAPACSDGRDNDADGMVDYPADSGCTTTSDGDETNTGTNVVAAAGDIVCDPKASNFDGRDPTLCQHRATQALLSGATAVLPLGDNQYADGTLAQYLGGYDPSWGQFASRTYPSVGNHEYHVSGAAGYFDYWASENRPTGGKGAGYYSFDLGSWHLIALNSNCANVSCKQGSAQNAWLERDLATTTKPCIAAYWHHPLFNSGTVHGSSNPPGAKAFWADLYAAGADLVLNGHEHNYQRYAKQTPTGQASPSGIRQIIVGTGGKSHYGLLSNKDPNFEFGNTTSFGVLRLTLEASSYRWQFVAPGGTVLDSGGPVACNA